MSLNSRRFIFWTLQYHKNVNRKDNSVINIKYENFYLHIAKFFYLLLYFLSFCILLDHVTTSSLLRASLSLCLFIFPAV